MPTSTQSSVSHCAPLPVHSGHLAFLLLVDTQSIEIFSEDGALVMTEQIFLGGPLARISAFAEGGAAEFDVSIDRLEVLGDAG
jgi:sucrose-6-phosphate hydrolase SacC (GH32 family)